MRGHGLVLHREMARVQRGRPEEIETHCPRLPKAHPPDRRRAPRSPGRARQHGVCCRWKPRQVPRQHLATCALSAHTCYGLHGPAVSCQGSRASPPSRRRTPTAIFMVPSTPRPSYNADLHAETSGLRTMSSRHGPHRLWVLREDVIWLAALQLDVALSVCMIVTLRPP